MQCWQCREPLQGPVCPGCGAIQPPAPRPELFALLGLERRFDLGRKAIDKAWRAISREVHPDRFAGASAVQRRMALQWTADVNHARAVLRDDTKRAWYLSTGSERPPERSPQPDPEFLELLFELNMLRAQDPQAAIAQAQVLRDEQLSALEQLFAREAEAASLEGVPAVLGKLKYLRTLIDGGHD